MQFPVVLHTDDGTHYGVIVPDLPGCFSGGNGIDDALAEAREAIDFHLEGLIEVGCVIPSAAGSIDQHQRNPDFADGIWALVDVDMSRFRTDRPTGTIDGFLGLLAGKTTKIATLEEINTLTAKTLQKSERGEDVHHSDSAEAMFRDMGI